MALRLIEMVLQDKDGVGVHELLKEHKVLEHRQVRLLGGELLVRILLDAEQSESVLDLLEKRYGTGVGNRLVVLPVEATLPRAESEPASSPGHLPFEESSPERIGREELYEDIKDEARCSRPYLTMVVLSTGVAAIGLQRNNVAIVIGAMVIALATFIAQGIHPAIWWDKERAAKATASRSRCGWSCWRYWSA